MNFLLEHCFLSVLLLLLFGKKGIFSMLRLSLFWLQFLIFSHAFFHQASVRACRSISYLSCWKFPCCFSERWLNLVEEWTSFWRVFFPLCDTVAFGFIYRSIFCGVCWVLSVRINLVNLATRVFCITTI